MAMVFIEGRNYGYPCVQELPELSGMVFPAHPYPKYLMRCLGNEVNEGYPCILSLANIVSEVKSSIFFAGEKAQALYFNGQFITSAYCNGEQIFGIYYHAE